MRTGVVIPLGPAGMAVQRRQAHEHQSIIEAAERAIEERSDDAGHLIEQVKERLDRDRERERSR